MVSGYMIGGNLADLTPCQQRVHVDVCGTTRGSAGMPCMQYRHGADVQLVYSRCTGACVTHLDPAVRLREDLQPPLPGQVLGHDHAVLAALIVHLTGGRGSRGEA